MPQGNIDLPLQHVSRLTVGLSNKFTLRKTEIVDVGYSCSKVIGLSQNYTYFLPDSIDGSNKFK